MCLGGKRRGKSYYEEHFYADSTNPFASEGYYRLHRGEQQVKAAWNYLKKMTATTKDPKQITFVKDAGSQSNGANELGNSFVVLKKTRDTPDRFLFMARLKFKV